MVRSQLTGTCRSCGAEVRTTKRGWCHEHTKDGRFCPGSGRLSKEALEARQ